MGFFAGRLNNVPTLSLNTATGGDINQHVNPADNSIFHSAMPFVLVTETYSANLSNGGENFYVCQMPSQIASLKTNDKNRVILTAIDYTYNGVRYRKFLQGTQTCNSRFTAGGAIDQPGGGNTPSSGWVWIAEQSGFSSDFSLDTGTYSYNSSLGHVSSIARSGTGGIVNNEIYRRIDRPAPGVLPTVIADAMAGLGYVAGAVAVPINASAQWYLNPDWSAPLGAGGTGHQWFYVSTGNIKNEVTAPQMYTYGSDKNVLFNPGGGYSRIACKSRASAIREAAGQANVGVWQDWYNFGIVPVSVTWYVTNLSYNGNGGYTINSNLFNGNDIHIAKNNFTIRGVDITTTPWKFINQVANSNLSARVDMEYVGLNPSFNNQSYGQGKGLVGVVGSNNGAMGTVAPQTGATQHQISIYNFAKSNTWYLDSNRKAIGNQYGDVWSPSQIPLKLFSGRSASAYIGDDINAKTIAANSYVALSTHNLGIPNNATATVILTSEIISGAIAKVAGIPTSAQGGVYSNQTRNKARYDKGDGIFHQILTLPAGQSVPFHTARLRAITTLGQNADYSYSIIFSIKNLGNGNVEIGAVTTGSSANLNTLVPYMRVTVQRLT